jgi:hypothetical protein
VKDIWDMTIPQINLLMPHLGKEIILKIFQQRPEEELDSSIESWEKATGLSLVKGGESL